MPNLPRGYTDEDLAQRGISKEDFLWAVSRVRAAVGKIDIRPGMDEGAFVGAAHESLARAISQYDSEKSAEGGFRSFFNTCLKNKLINEVRDQCRDLGYVSNYSYLEDTEPDPSSVETTVIRRIGFGRVRSALDSLPEMQRYVVENNLIEGHTLADIARSRGIPRSRVDSLKRRAIKNLQFRIGNDAAEF